ncbi:MAG: hypothetical protein OEV89_07505 [Desulfobulbaceae bacterium]|nr:hypothetical protein [Desulfobulbaceae bacterium]HIJ90599.1 hypothetical protein [Deltaproteobacteria bacterium]
MLDDFLQTCKEELQPLCSLGSGGSWQLMVDMLYHIRLFRYATQAQIKQINSRYEKICGKKKLDKLVQLGMLAGEYRATPKTTKLLKELGYNVNLLQPEPTGDGGVDSILKTDVFIKARKMTNFKALLFPRFPKDTPYLIPDALLVLAEDNRYQLNFLEIETDKFYHDEYLENKRQNYERLGKDDQVYRYWENVSEQLGLKKPSKEQFKFSVTCVGNIKKEFRAWDFVKEIS